MRIAKIIFLLISCFTFMNTSAQDLDTHTWNNRIVIIKASSVASNNYQAQLKQFEDATDEMIARKFVLYTILGEDVSFINYEDSTKNKVGKLTEDLAKILNQKHNFEILLIGLDGGIKRSETEVLTKNDLFEIVDAMPMRRSELRKNKGKH